jgi:hypothetical protein
VPTHAVGGHPRIRLTRPTRAERYAGAQREAGVPPLVSSRSAYLLSRAGFPSRDLSMCQRLLGTHQAGTTTVRAISQSDVWALSGTARPRFNRTSRAVTREYHCSDRLLNSDPRLTREGRAASANRLRDDLRLSEEVAGRHCHYPTPASDESLRRPGGAWGRRTFDNCMTGCR